jgi:hypothetical protein
VWSGVRPPKACSRFRTLRARGRQAERKRGGARSAPSTPSADGSRVPRGGRLQRRRAGPGRLGPLPRAPAPFKLWRQGWAGVRGARRLAGEGGVRGAPSSSAGRQRAPRLLDAPWARALLARRGGLEAARAQRPGTPTDWGGASPKVAPAWRVAGGKRPVRPPEQEAGRRATRVLTPPECGAGLMLVRAMRAGRRACGRHAGDMTESLASKRK